MSARSPIRIWTGQLTGWQAGCARSTYAPVSGSRWCSRTPPRCRRPCTACRCGAALAPINPTIKEGKLARLLAHVGAAAVICDAEREPIVRAAARRTGDIRVIADLDALGPATATRLPSLLGADLAAVIYTSGSTGEPKGVTMTHANMSFVAGSIVEYLAMDPSDRILSVLPLSFGYGLYQLLTCVHARATLVLEPGLGLAGRLVAQLEQDALPACPACRPCSRG